MTKQVYAVILGIAREGWQDVTLYSDEGAAESAAIALDSEYNTKDTSYYVSVQCWDVL